MTDDENIHTKPEAGETQESTKEKKERNNLPHSRIKKIAKPTIEANGMTMISETATQMLAYAVEWCLGDLSIRAANISIEQKNKKARTSAVVSYESLSTIVSTTPGYNFLKNDIPIKVKSN